MTIIQGAGLGWEAGGRRILGPLDLTFAANETICLIGPNGAGKTSLLRLVAGVLTPTRGELHMEGQPYSALRGLRLARRIAYVPQIRPARIPLSVEEVVLQGRYPHFAPGSPGKADFAAVSTAFEQLDIPGLRGRRVDQLSGGERQAVFLAAALAQEADVMVLDEPTTHLDPRHAVEITRLLLRLRAASKLTIVLSTHDLDLVALLADRVVAIRSGLLKSCLPVAQALTPESLTTLFDVPFVVGSLPRTPRAQLGSI